VAAFSRRSFLSRAVLLLGGPGSGLVPRFDSPPKPPDDLALLTQRFTDPPEAAKPLTRWWWFGGAVTKEEITRELTFMREAGLRGAEIQPVYPVAVDDPSRGIRNLRYFTEEWFGVLRHAVMEARRLGLQLDFTLGSGWPYGGPFIPTALASRRLRVLSLDVVGPREVSWPLTAQLTGDDRVVAVVAAPLLPNEEPDLSRAEVLPDQPRREAAYNVATETVIRNWPAPAGRFRLMVFLDSPTGMQVKRATLGMEGNVLDHHRKEAMDLFLRSAGDRVLTELASAASPPFHSVFCDSLEVYGADWTADLLPEFSARRGYDLTPLLPALDQQAGPTTSHIRYDFHLTLSELLLDGFFRPLAEWSERHGMKARIQAHGAMGDVMQGYGLAHIPEGENIFGGDHYRVNLRHRRLASSAAHLYGKSLASAETYTWLRTPLYTTTLEMMKAATDSVFLDGINHVVNHGYSYSPASVGEPGWAFYASTEINHTNTWWRHYPHLARYVQRVQALLQQGRATSPVAVYVPLADIYAEHGAGGLNFDNEIERRVDPELLPGLRRSGYDFDMIHDHALASLARVAEGQLLAGHGAYRVVIVPGARFMPPETAARLLELVQGGGHVIFIERMPDAAPGLSDAEARNDALLRSLDALWGHGQPQTGGVHAMGAGSVALAADREAAQMRLESVLAPDVRIVEAGDGGTVARQAAIDNVGFVHRRSGAVDYYFVANVSGQGQDLRFRFAVGHRTPEIWNVETGAIERPLAYEYTKDAAGTSTEVMLHLDPYESCFVVFGHLAGLPAWTRLEGPSPLVRPRPSEHGAVGLAAAAGIYTLTAPSGRKRQVVVADLPPPEPIEGPWTLVLGSAPPLTLPQLRSWVDLPEGRSFSGWGTYETEFGSPPLGSDLEWVIDLGQVHETAEVSLNGRSLGVAWKGLRRLDCGSALRTGRNRLRIEVANLWIHHVVAQPPTDWRGVEETMGIRWGRYGEVAPDTLPPAGLLGPVRLLARKPIPLER
jgi:hypothetical protein